MPPTKPILCPTCRKLASPEGEDFPFCSDRCRLIDLGKWASGDYKISSPIFDPDLLDSLENADLDHTQQQNQPFSEESKWKN